MNYPKRFTPSKTAGLTIKNRIVMTAMDVCFAGADGQSSLEIIKYYETRARGGAGLINTEVTRIDDVYSKGMPHQFSATEMKYIASLQQ